MERLFSSILLLVHCPVGLFDRVGQFLKTAIVGGAQTHAKVSELSVGADNNRVRTVEIPLKTSQHVRSVGGRQYE